MNTYLAKLSGRIAVYHGLHLILEGLIIILIAVSHSQGIIMELNIETLCAVFC